MYKCRSVDCRQVSYISAFRNLSFETCKNINRKLSHHRMNNMMRFLQKLKVLISFLFIGSSVGIGRNGIEYVHKHCKLFIHTKFQIKNVWTIYLRYTIHLEMFRIFPEHEFWISNFFENLSCGNEDDLQNSLSGSWIFGNYSIYLNFEKKKKSFAQISAYCAHNTYIEVKYWLANIIISELNREHGFYLVYGLRWPC